MSDVPLDLDHDVRRVADALAAGRLTAPRVSVAAALGDPVARRALTEQAVPALPPVRAVWSLGPVRVGGRRELHVHSRGNVRGRRSPRSREHRTLVAEAAHLRDAVPASREHATALLGVSAGPTSGDVSLLT